MPRIEQGLRDVKIKWRDVLKTDILPLKCKDGLFAKMDRVVYGFYMAVGKVNKHEKIINFQNMTDNDLKIIAEKFIYLNTCPGIFRPWILFYMDLFQNEPPHKIILILNRILKGPQDINNSKWKKITRILFGKVLESLHNLIQKTNVLNHTEDGHSSIFKGKNTIILM